MVSPLEQLGRKKGSMRTAINQAILAACVLVFGLGTPMGPSLALADPPKPLAKVAVPHHLSAMAWSADGVYIAACAWGWWAAGEKASPSEIYVIDVGRASATTTLKIPASFPGPALAFSPDGKWLAVGTS
jgi:hypothetical protein